MIVTSLLVLLATLLILRKLVQVSKYKFPPGPRGLPLLGNYLQLGPFPLFNFEKGIKWSKQFGDIFTTSIVGYKLVVLSSIEAIKASSLLDVGRQSIIIASVFRMLTSLGPMTLTTAH